MSLYVEWINLIKERADDTWLTHTQREVYEQVVSHWQTTDFVNLYGPPGAGKTFIAQVLAKMHGYAYAHDLQDAPESSANVVLDDAQYTRVLRLVRKELGLGRVILLTRSVIPEAMPKAELLLDDKDVRQFQATLSNHCGIVFTGTVPEGCDLAEIIRREVVKRGESHVYRGS
jgi:energy-coupling factor transporter ATP-binding protein EcfA2